MERAIETTLGNIIFYAKSSTGDIYEIEKVMVYHSRDLAEDDTTVIDTINFSSPNRCNLYGDRLTKSMDYNIHKHSKYVDIVSNKTDEILQIIREDYYIISGIVDFLIYHKFTTSMVDLNTTLDNEDNYDNAVWEVKNIVQHIKEDLSHLRDRKRPLYIMKSNSSHMMCKLKVKFIEKEKESVG